MNYLILYLTSCVAIDRDSCCNTDGITNFHEPDLETLGCVTQCMIKLGFQILTEDDMILSQTQCATDCIGKKKGYITEDGRFLVRAFWNMTDERLKGRKYDKAITKCFREYERASTSDGPYNDLELKVLYCIYKDVQLRCPIIKQDHPKKCMALQKYLRNDDREIPRQPCDEKMANKFVSFFETMVKGVESAAS